MNSESVARRIRARRDQLGLTRAQVAERCARLGYDMPAAAIAYMELGRGRGGDPGKRRVRAVTVDDLCALSAALGIEIIDLIGDRCRECSRCERCSNAWTPA